MSETLTACVIARDEEQRLPACLASLEFCDEVVVVDSGSTDRTREIAREAGALVIENPWQGFAVQRNVALDHANGTWVLEIDADERVSPELAREMKAALDDLAPEVRMAALPMRDVFLGRPLGPSARYPRYRHRLFRRGAFRHDEARTVHEGLWPDGPTAALEGELRHLLASSWPEALRDAVAYARLDAAQRARPGAREALLGIVVRPTAKLAYRLLLYGGWRDGLQGVARVWLECAADSLAVVLRLRGGGQGTERGLGQEAPRQGPVRLVGVGFDPESTQDLSGWLRQAAEAGADVAMISRGQLDDPSLPFRRLDGSGPGALARALDAEDQVRPIDALVLADGRHGRRLLKLVPAALRGATGPLSPESPPAEAVRDVQHDTRSPETT